MNVSASKSIKLIRVERGLSQKELGELVGLTGAQISNIEKGKSAITKDVQHKIAKALSIDPEIMRIEPIEQKSESIEFIKQQFEELKSESLKKDMEINRLWDLINRLIPTNSQQLGKLLALKSLPKPFYLGADLGAANELPLAG